MTFGQKLEKYRELKDLTPTELGRRLDKSKTYIFNIEKGSNKPPPFDMCMKIFRELDLSEGQIKDMLKTAFEERIANLDQDFLDAGLEIIFKGKIEK